MKDSSELRMKLSKSESVEVVVAEARRDDDKIVVVIGLIAVFGVVTI